MLFHNEAKQFGFQSVLPAPDTARALSSQVYSSYGRKFSVGDASIIIGERNVDIVQPHMGQFAHTIFLLPEETAPNFNHIAVIRKLSPLSDRHDDPSSLLLSHKLVLPPVLGLTVDTRRDLVRGARKSTNSKLPKWTLGNNIRGYASEDLASRLLLTLRALPSR